jgi:DNA mismatch endonuclease (patch repair protein)
MPGGKLSAGVAFCRNTISGRMPWNYMTDVFSKRKRSAVMAAIRSKGNKDTELALAAIFRRNGLNGWRRHLQIPGKPDFVFPVRRVAVFVDGCFWHGCRWHGRKPDSNQIYWNKKLDNNKARDRKVTRLLRQKGWKVLRIWEHELKKEQRVVARVVAAISLNNQSVLNKK